MIVEFCRWGNSLAVRISKAFADTIMVHAHLPPPSYIG
jgi:antitoxin component of MazEF toxin-antitoxin module